MRYASPGVHSDSVVRVLGACCCGAPATFRIAVGKLSEILGALFDEKQCDDAGENSARLRRFPSRDANCRRWRVTVCRSEAPSRIRRRLNR